MFGSKRRDLILWYRGFSSFFFSIQIRWRTSNIYAPEKMDTKKSSYLNGPFFSKTHVVKLPGGNVPDVRSVRRNSHSRRMREYPGLRTPEDGAWWMMATCNLWSWFNGMKCHAYGYQLSHCGYCYGIIGIINHDNIFWGDLWGREIPCNVPGGRLLHGRPPYITGPQYEMVFQ